MVRRALLGAVVLLALQAGCVARLPPLPVPPELTPPTAGTLDPRFDPEVRYLLARDPSSGAVLVEVGLRGHDSGTTLLELAEGWAGVRHLARELGPLQAAGAGGEPREAMAVPTLGSDGEQRWLVRHRPGEPIRIRYLLPVRRGLPAADAAFRPIVTPRFFHLIGNVGLVYPLHLVGARRRRIELRWRGFAEAGWQVASSFGQDPAGVQVTRTLRAFRHAFFLAGDLAREQSPLLPGGQLDALLPAGGIGLAPQGFVTLAARILEAQRSFFADTSDRHFTVAVVPVLPSKGGFGMAGFRLTSSVVLFLSRPVSPAPGNPGLRQLLALLSHELLHHWNGGKIRRQNGGELLWFSEGFTDALARRILFRAGLLSIEEYRADLNRVLAELHRSQARTRTGSELAAGHWRERSLRQLSYLRGDVMALVLDHALRQASRGQRRLDDLFRRLLAEAQDGGRRLTRTVLLQRVEELAGPAAALALRRVVIDGALPAVPETLLAPCLALVPTTGDHAPSLRLQDPAACRDLL